MGRASAGQHPLLGVVAMVDDDGGGGGGGGGVDEGGAVSLRQKRGRRKGKRRCISHTALLQAESASSARSSLKLFHLRYWKRCVGRC
jgi:hypothetical protein